MRGDCSGFLGLVGEGGKTITQRTQCSQRRERGRSLAALDRKNPPFANNAKDGAPSSFFVRDPDEEHSY